MNKQTRIIFIAAALMFLAGVVGSILILRAPHSQTVQIVQGGNVLYTFDLSRQDDQEIRVEYEGRTNVIQIQNGRIRMLEADCPDHICIQMGWLDSAAPIVCLPNHLVIQFASSHDSVDTVF